MQRYLGKYSEAAFALVRIVAGLMLACHGAQKLFGVLGGNKVDLFSQMGLAGVIELLGGLLIALGLLASWAAFVASGEMAVAYFQAHLPHGLLPIQNHGELAVLNALFFLYVAARGAGPWSLDRGRH